MRYAEGRNLITSIPWRSANSTITEDGNGYRITGTNTSSYFVTISVTSLPSQVITGMEISGSIEITNHSETDVVNIMFANDWDTLTIVQPKETKRLSFENVTQKGTSQIVFEFRTESAGIPFDVAYHNAYTTFGELTDYSDPPESVPDIIHSITSDSMGL